MKQRKALKAVERRAQIMDFAARQSRDFDGWWTVSRLARSMNITPSTKLRKMINDMVRRGTLIETAEGWTGAVGTRYVYRISDRAMKSVLDAKAKQSVIKINGVPITREV